MDMQLIKKLNGGKFIFCIMVESWAKSLKHVPELGLPLSTDGAPRKLNFREKSKQKDMRSSLEVIPFLLLYQLGVSCHLVHPKWNSQLCMRYHRE